MADDIRSSVLVRRMVWRNLHNLEYREPRGGDSDEDKRYNEIAVRMLTCISCMNYAMLDLEESLISLGRYRHNVKRVFKMYSKRVVEAHEIAFRMLRKVNEVSSRQYNDYTDYYWGRICNKVSLDDVLLRSYSIVVSLSRLIKKYNTMLLGRYDFAPAQRLYDFSERLSVFGIEAVDLDADIEDALSGLYS